MGSTLLISRLPPSTIRTRELAPNDMAFRSSKGTPSFIQISVGSGMPLGGPHSSRAVSPLATRVSLGSTRKSSRKTAIWSEAWRLTAWPTRFLATHQYSPPSCSFLPCIVL
uniref:RT09859p n=1 Tax=Drosophila melanogaster TaxID=7227 RepID=E0R959_DROME|nr:RT09859p [Drosophila melanogaster]